MHLSLGLFYVFINAFKGVLVRHPLSVLVEVVDNAQLRYHVVYAVDANQRRGLQASLQSLIDNFDPKRRHDLRVHVLYQSKKLSQEDICLQFLSRTSVADSVPMQFWNREPSRHIAISRSRGRSTGSFEL